MAAYTTIDDSSAFFKPVLYTGDGNTGRSVTFSGATMQPDLVWIKNRDQGDIHVWFDSVRGVTKYVSSSTRYMQITDANTLTAFDSNGFEIDDDVIVNTNTEDYVCWNWKAGTTGTDLSAGTITPTSSNINTTTGFGIYAYNSTGAAATIAHGLGVVPQVIICRQLTSGGGDTVRDWPVYHHSNTDAPETESLVLSSDVATDDNLLWNDTLPTSTLISIGGGAEVNQVSGTYVMYVFAPIQGYSSFGFYEGNGNADGPFVYTGFQPALVITKNAESTGEWNMYTSTTELSTCSYLYANSTSSEGSGSTLCFDLVSNGFKIKTDNADRNASGDNFIYMAFAKAPFVNSSGVPGNAKASSF